jgi:hypothetical protein
MWRSIQARLDLSFLVATGIAALSNCFVFYAAPDRIRGSGLASSPILKRHRPSVQINLNEIL